MFDAPAMVALRDTLSKRRQCRPGGRNGTENILPVSVSARQLEAVEVQGANLCMCPSRMLSAGQTPPYWRDDLDRKLIIG